MTEFEKALAAAEAIIVGLASTVEAFNVRDYKADMALDILENVFGREPTHDEQLELDCLHDEAQVILKD